jgi:hypothetical protein
MCSLRESQERFWCLLVLVQYNTRLKPRVCVCVCFLYTHQMRWIHMTSRVYINVRLICTPYMYALYVRLICTPYIYALHLCLTSMPYMYADALDSHDKQSGMDLKESTIIFRSGVHALYVPNMSLICP